MIRILLNIAASYYKIAISIIVLLYVLWQTLQPTDVRFVMTDVNLTWIIELLACLVIVTCIVHRLQKGLWHTDFHVEWSDLFVLLWLTYYCCRAWFWSEIPCATDILKNVSLFVLYFALRLFFTFYRLPSRALILGLLLFCGYEAWLGIFQMISGQSNHLVFLITGTFYNPGPYSAYLVLGAVILLSMLYSESSGMYLFEYRTVKTIYFYYGLLILILLILPATWSRSAFVALAMMCLWIYRDKYGKYKYYLWGTIVIAVIGLYFVKKGSADGRLVIWMSSLTSWQHSPLIGTGIGSFFHAEADGLSELFSDDRYLQSANSADVANFMCNDYLQVLVEQGVIGALLCALAAISMLVKLHSHCRSLCYGVIALFIFSVTSYPFDLLPYKLIVVLIAAWGISQPRSETNGNVVSRMFHRPLHHYNWISCVIVTGMILSCCTFMKAEMEKRIEAESSYRLFSHSGQEAFINDYYELLPLENDNQSFLFDFGQLLRSFGRYSDSNAILQKGTMVSNDPMFYVLIGNNYKDMKCYDLSEMAYQKAYSIMPNRLYPLYQLMLLYETEGKTEKMSEMAQRVLSFKEKVVSPATREMKMKAREMIDSIESRMMKHINGYNEH